MKSDIKRIALIGPESSGKTTLCRELASHYMTAWVPEFARDYVAQLNKRSQKYTLEDIEYCYKEQMKLEEEFLRTASKYLFVDTELIIAKVWSEDVFKKVPKWIEENILPFKYDLYLLTANDLPWVHDPVRENPDRTQFFFDWYKRELEKYKFPYEVISGKGKERFENAVAAIEKWNKETMQESTP